MKRFLIPFSVMLATFLVGCNTNNAVENDTNESGEVINEDVNDNNGVNNAGTDVIDKNAENEINQDGTVDQNGNSIQEDVNNNNNTNGAAINGGIEESVTNPKEVENGNVDENREDMSAPKIENNH
ncbi:hypothetical protein ACIQ34_20325 [Ureibacillus sp. NPDC094379]